MKSPHEDPQEDQDVLFALLERGEEAIDLPMVWVALTAAVKGPINADATLAVLSEMKGVVRDRLAPLETAPLRERLSRLNDVIVNDFGFKGDTETYSDPANSYIDDVLIRRRGIPITLSMVFMELGKALGLQIDPVAFPGHFLVKERTKHLICDPFAGRVNLSGSDCLTIASRVFGREVIWNEEYLAVCSKRNLILRVLNNLRNSFQSLNDQDRLELTKRMIERLENLGQFHGRTSLH